MPLVPGTGWTATEASAGGVPMPTNEESPAVTIASAIKTRAEPRSRRR
jgi:hypothetical protein